MDSFFDHHKANKHQDEHSSQDDKPSKHHNKEQYSSYEGKPNMHHNNEHSSYDDKKPYKGHNEYSSHDDKPSSKYHQHSDDDKSGKHHKDSSSDEKKPKNNKPSNAELLSSAKLVADTARASLRGDHDKVDKTKVAQAAGDLLNAASHHGKLDEKGYGKYIEKAEEYLHNYNNKPHSNDTHSSSLGTKPTSTSDHSGHSGSTTKPNGGHKDSGGGYGDYLKMAEGLIKKH